MLWIRRWTHKAGIVNSNPACIPTARKATGKQLINFIFLEERSEPCLCFLLSSKSSMLHR